MTTAAERKAHAKAGLRASDFPSPPTPPEGWPNAEWLEDYRRWHHTYVRALLNAEKAGLRSVGG